MASSWSSSASDTQSQYLIFVVAAQSYAVPISDVREVVLMAELSPTLGPSQYFQGLLNLSGEAIAVVRLNRLLGLEDFKAGLYSHIILSQYQGKSFGFLTEGVQKILLVAKSDLTEVQADKTFGGFATAMLRDGKDFVPCLSLSNVLKSLTNEILNGSSVLSSPSTITKAAS
ncbi:MAG: chemotaxis protein CheW [Proteobacteria bacterium]|nr:MAG: chemotaxis protein CheW [Pseudomonadota bacterium]